MSIAFIIVDYKFFMNESVFRPRLDSHLFAERPHLDSHTFAKLPRSDSSLCADLSCLDHRVYADLPRLDRHFFAVHLSIRLLAAFPFHFIRGIPFRSAVLHPTYCFVCKEFYMCHTSFALSAAAFLQRSIRSADQIVFNALPYSLRYSAPNIRYVPNSFSSLTPVF
jgi:hypothetical protein